jgi:hypothetical protein
MKYTKKSLAVLTGELRGLIDQNLRFKLTQSEGIAAVHQFFDYHFKTDNGKKRYPDYYRSALNAFWYEFLNVRIAEDLLWCYEIDGKLYTNYNKNNPSKYCFKGITDLPCYRDNPEIEKRLLSDNNVIRGTYYPCGKPYFVTTKI